QHRLSLHGWRGVFDAAVGRAVGVGRQPVSRVVLVYASVLGQCGKPARVCAPSSLGGSGDRGDEPGALAALQSMVDVVGGLCLGTAFFSAVNAVLGAVARALGTRYAGRAAWRARSRDR